MESITTAINSTADTNKQVTQVERKLRDWMYNLKHSERKKNHTKHDKALLQFLNGNDKPQNQHETSTFNDTEGEKPKLLRKSL